MSIENLREDLLEVIKKNGFDASNYDLAFKDFIKYFGVTRDISPREKEIIESIKDLISIRVIPKEVVNMQNLMPNIIATVKNGFNKANKNFNNLYEQVLYELDKHILSVMVNDIVRSNDHKSLYNDYRSAVKIHFLKREEFEKTYIFSRVIEKDSTGQFKKSVRNIISASDGRKFVSLNVDFVDNINKFSNVLNVSFRNKIKSESLSDEGISKIEEKFSLPTVYNENIILLAIKNTKYLADKNKYKPLKQFFEIVLIYNS